MTFLVKELMPYSGWGRRAAKCQPYIRRNFLKFQPAHFRSMNPGKSVDIIPNVMNFWSEGLSSLVAASSAPAKASTSLPVPRSPHPKAAP